MERLYREQAVRQGVASVQAAGLRVGMVLAEDARLTTGTLLVARGYDVTASFIERIKNFPPGMLPGVFRIMTP